MAKIMELIERFVVAVEKIAVAQQQYCSMAAGKKDCCPSPAPEKTTDQIHAEIGKCLDAAMGASGMSAEDLAKSDSAKLTREMIKKELIAKGITFAPTARTETLQKLLEGANKVGIPDVKDEKPEKDPFSEPPKTVEPEPDPFATETQTAPAPAATKDEARDALVALSGLKGKDVALKVLKEKGKAEKLSDVAAECYGAIVAECNTLKGANANA